MFYKIYYIHINNVSDLNPLKNMNNLEYLSLYSNNVSDLTPLSNMFSIKSLYLNNNKIIFKKAIF